MNYTLKELLEYYIIFTKKSKDIYNNKKLKFPLIEPYLQYIPLTLLEFDFIFNKNPYNINDFNYDKYEKYRLTKYDGEIHTIYPPFKDLYTQILDGTYLTIDKENILNMITIHPTVNNIKNNTTNNLDSTIYLHNPVYTANNPDDDTSAIYKNSYNVYLDVFDSFKIEFSIFINELLYKLQKDIWL